MTPHPPEGSLEGAPKPWGTTPSVEPNTPGKKADGISSTQLTLLKLDVDAGFHEHGVMLGWLLNRYGPGHQKMGYVGFLSEELSLWVWVDTFYLCLDP